MKAIKIYEPGDSSKLIYEEVPTPKVKKGWSLVKVKGFGINHSEIYTRKGQSPSVKFPRILGIECVGEISESTCDLKKGDKVISFMGEMGRAYDGSYAEYCLLPNENIFKIESNMTWENLAAMPETYYTAYISLLNLNIKEDDKVLVRGATSGVGNAFLTLLKGKYPQIIVDGTSRTIKKEKLLLDEGFDHVIIDNDNVLQTNNTYDKVLDLIGPSGLKDTFKHVNRHGIVCMTGLLGNKWSLDFEPLVDMPSSTYLTVAESSDRNKKRVQSLINYIEKYNIDISPTKVFKLEEIREAHNYLESAHSFGKVVIIND